MVAEPTLFLTKDRRVQVRAHKTNGGAELYCVKDFIRQTAGVRMGPDDAMLYWLSSLAHLIHEREVLNVYVIQFMGPYETPTACISAQGLLILYHHLNERHSWVNQQYKEEVQDTLMRLALNGSWAGFVEMHDDGEVEEQLAERGDSEIRCPPEGSRFNYADEFDAEQLTTEQINRRMEEGKRLADGLLLRLEASEAELEATRAKLHEHEAVQERKRQKGAGFRLGSLVPDLSAADRDQVCKAVVAGFRARFPERGTFVKHGAVHFFAEDRPIVEALVREAYSRVSFGVLP
jgi:hypothetical protein